MKKSTAPRILAATGLEENNVRYATGLAAADPFLLLVHGARLHLAVSALEAARARRTCPAAVLHTPAELFAHAPPGPRGLGAQALALARRLGLRTVRAGPYFPLGIARALERGGVRVRLAEQPAFPRRAVKTAREIACLAKAQRAAVAAMRAAIQAIRAAKISAPGRLLRGGKLLTSEILKDLIEQTLRAHGCSAVDTIVAVGPQGARPHDAGHGPLRAGVPIVIDIFPRDKDTGYWGDITRTVVRGRAPARIRRLYRAVLGAQRLALAMIRPGVAGRSVQAAVETYFRDAGYETRWTPPGRERGFIHSLGHGIGLDVHESPGLRREPGRLRAGNVVTVEPGLYLPGVGGVRLEDVVAVTPAGYKILASFPKTLEV